KEPRRPCSFRAFFDMRNFYRLLLGGTNCNMVPRVSARVVRDGFTLVELLVVISVIAVLSTLFMAGFRSDGSALALDRSSRAFTQSVDQVRSLSLSGGQHEGETVSGGFGFYTQEGQGDIILFADCNGDGEYQENGASSTCVASASEQVEVVQLESGITLSSVTPCTSGACTITVVFVPPYAMSSFSPALAGTEAVFILSGREGATREVRINTLGVATIE
ncbi:MAG: type II secretion system protein, partial [Candidatus Spechtbacterales bacterium]